MCEPGGSDPFFSSLPTKIQAVLQGAHCYTKPTPFLLLGTQACISQECSFIFLPCQIHQQCQQDTVNEWPGATTTLWSSCWVTRVSIPSSSPCPAMSLGELSLRTLLTLILHSYPFLVPRHWGSILVCAKLAKFKTQIKQEPSSFYHSPSPVFEDDHCSRSSLVKW